MKRLKTIENVINDSALKDNEKTSISSYLDSQISSNLSNIDTPWFVKIISIIGTWIGSFLFLLFLFQLNILNSEISVIISGTIMIVSGISLSYLKSNAIVESILFAILSIGQIMVIFGLISNKTHDLKVFLLIIILIEIPIYLFAKNYVQKLISVIAIPLCIMAIIQDASYNTAIGPDTISAMYISILLSIISKLLISSIIMVSSLIWIFETKIQLKLKHFNYFYSPTAYGLIISSILLLLLSHDNFSYNFKISLWYITTIFSFAALSFIIFITLKNQFNLSLKKYLIIISVIALILLPTVNSPGIITSLLIIILAFSNGNKLLFTLGISFFAVFLSFFYYSLQQTLLLKSIILMSSGALFILLYFVFTKIIRHGKTV